MLAARKLPSLGEFEYSSGKSLNKRVHNNMQQFFLLQHPIIELPLQALHYISCIALLSNVFDTISTLPERYRSCKCEPI